MRVDAGSGGIPYRGVVRSTPEKGAVRPAQGGAPARRAGPDDAPVQGQRAQAGQQPPRTLNELSAEEQRLIQQLRNRDREVRAHELAHQSTGGRYAGAASFSYQVGPDGQRYAIGGEVPLRLQTTGDPEAVLQNAEQVRRAALAPAEPSAQDQRIAARAAAAAAEARQELRQGEAQGGVEARAEGVGPGEGAGRAERVEGAGRSGARTVSGEYIDRVDTRRFRAPPAPQSPAAAVFAAIQQMGPAEFMSQGGRLDTYV